MERLPAEFPYFVSGGYRSPVSAIFLSSFSVSGLFAKLVSLIPSLRTEDAISFIFILERLELLSGEEEVGGESCGVFIGSVGFDESYHCVNDVASIKSESPCELLPFAADLLMERFVKGDTRCLCQKRIVDDLLILQRVRHQIPAIFDDQRLGFLAG